MRRPVLITLAAVGGVVVLLGSTGIFAALTDTARSGTNSIETDGLPPSSDLQMAPADANPGVISCGLFSENLTSEPITLTGPPGAGNGYTLRYCVRNVGSQTVSLTAMVEEFTDVETGCTGDEGIYDTSCGSDQGGELGDFVTVLHEQLTCEPFATDLTESMLLRDNQATPANLGLLGPGQTRCFAATAFNFGASQIQRQLAQSDRLTWRFAWTGQA